MFKKKKANKKEKYRKNKFHLNFLTHTKKLSEPKTKLKKWNLTLFEKISIFLRNRFLVIFRSGEKEKFFLSFLLFFISSCFFFFCFILSCLISLYHISSYFKLFYLVLYYFILCCSVQFNLLYSINFDFSFIILIRFIS